MEATAIQPRQNLVAIKPSAGKHSNLILMSTKSPQMFTTLYKSVPAISPQMNTYNKVYSSRTPVLGGGTIKMSGRMPSASSAEQFAYRFRPQVHKPSSPHIVGINHQAKLPRTAKKFQGFFPPVKLRSADSRTKPEHDTQHDNPLTLEPVGDSESDVKVQDTFRTSTTTDTHKHVDNNQAIRAYRSISTTSQQSHPSNKSTANSTDCNQVVHKYMFSTPTYPHILPGTQNCHDFTYLPKPRGSYPSGDVPWVYRHKVKRNMNELSKIMSSRVTLADPGEYNLPF